MAVVLTSGEAMKSDRRLAASCLSTSLCAWHDRKRQQATSAVCRSVQTADSAALPSTSSRTAAQVSSLLSCGRSSRAPP